MAIETGAAKPAAGTGSANWKTQVYLIGAVFGLVLGLLSAYLYVRAAEENNQAHSKPKLRTGDAMKLTLGVLGLVRQIADLGNKN